MVTCANITLEKIRCRISFGDLEFETPEVLSFSVNRARGTLASSFSCSLEVPANTVFPTNRDIVIEAGTLGNMQRLMTGGVRSITVNPSFEDAANYVVNLSGQDAFQKLEGKNISRRQRTRGGVTFAAITSIISKAPQKGTSLELHKQSGGSSRVPSSDTNLREHSKLVKTDRVGWDPFGTAKAPERKDASGQEDTTNILDIKPKAVSMSPGVRALFQVQGTSWTQGDTWAVSDEDIGTISDNQDGTATYTMIGIGENTITYTDSSGSTFTGTATATAIPIHDHSSLGAGGPAWAVYGTD